jgi:hypothetical protein
MLKGHGEQAKKLEGTFLPMEVKFINMNQFERSAKKNMINKYPTINNTPHPNSNAPGLEPI